MYLLIHDVINSGSTALNGTVNGEQGPGTGSHAAANVALLPPQHFTGQLNETTQKVGFVGTRLKFEPSTALASLLFHF
jgi:hypothetical protein